MESLDTRLQKRMNAALYALVVLASALGVVLLVDSCKQKKEVNLKTKIDNNGIALRTKAF